MIIKLKILHFGDLHLEMPFTSLSSGNLSSKRRYELLECFDRLIYIANNEGVDAIIIAGDLFEHGYISKATLNHINNKFNEILHIPIFIIPGNHDPLSADSYYRSFCFSENVNILNEDKPYAGTALFRVHAYLDKKHEFLLEKKMVNILLTHGTVDLNIGDKAFNPMSSRELSGFGMDYVALGHFHNTLLNIGGYNCIYNPGSPEPLGFDEEGEHGAFLVSFEKNTDSGKCEKEVKFIPTAKRKYKTFELKIDDFTTNQQIVSTLINTFELDTQGLYKIVLKGYKNKEFDIDEEYILESLKDKTFFVKLQNQTEENFNIEDISKEIGLRGIFVRKILERMNGTENPEEKELLNKAMSYGLIALEKGEID